MEREANGGHASRQSSGEVRVAKGACATRARGSGRETDGA